MDFSRRQFVGAAIATVLGGLAPASVPEPAATLLRTAPAVPKQADRPPLLDEAMAALDTHQGRVVQRDLLGLVDFSAHSSTPRFQLVDVASGRVAASCLVAHGSGSDPAHTGWVQRFSNRPGSNASSQGSYLTAHAYVGKHGRARRLIGLDPENSLALDRAIVIHGADYVSEDLAEAQGRIGRSQGCFAFSQQRIAAILDRLGEGRLLYASDKQLAKSRTT
jgi:hypothetical protein